MAGATFTWLLGEAGWRPVHREDLTGLVARLHEVGAWPWGEYVRPGFRYVLHGLEATPGPPGDEL